MKENDQSLLFRLRDTLQALSPAEKRVGIALIADYPITGLKTVTEIAEAAGTSPATVSRFAEALGFTGFPELQRTLHKDVAARFSSPGLQFAKTTERTGESGPQQMAAMFGTMVSDTVRHLDPQEVRSLVEKLIDPKRTIYFVGGRHSRALARYFQQQLHHLRHRTVYFDGVNADAIDALVEFDSRAVLVLFDFRRYQHDSVRYAAAANSRRAHVVLFTDPYTSPAIKHARQVFVCQTATSSPFDSYASGIALIDCLVMELTLALGEEGHRRIDRLEQAREEFGLEYVLKD